jgi:hypothetical protein
MWDLLFEAFIMGWITWVIGTIIFNLTINYNNNLNQSQPIGINLAFYITGVIFTIGCNKLNLLLN